MIEFEQFLNLRFYLQDVNTVNNIGRVASIEAEYWNYIALS